MVSDSRKLLSYGSRFEMFRRTLANVVGEMVDRDRVAWHTPNTSSTIWPTSGRNRSTASSSHSCLRPELAAVENTEHTYSSLPTAIVGTDDSAN